jgi:hypothetical protein
MPLTQPSPKRGGRTLCYLKTPSGVGLFIGGPGPRPVVFLFFGGAEHDYGFACESRPRRRKTKKQNRRRCGPSFPWTVVAPTGSTGSRPCRRLPIGATAGCQPALHSRRDLRPGSWSQCALKKRGGYKQANPTGFSQADLEWNLCCLAGNVGNDKRFGSDSWWGGF